MWEAVGLGEQDAQVYEALVRCGQADASTLTAELTLSRGRIVRTLAVLVSRGLATRLPGRPARFAAVAPDEVAAPLIAGREYELLQLRRHVQGLAEIHRRAAATRQHPADLVEIVEGPENVRRAITLLHQEARRQVCLFDRPPYVGEGSEYEAQGLDVRKIEFRVVYDRSAIALPGRIDEIWKSVRRGERARVGEVPMKLLLCDGRKALIPAESADASYLIHSSALLDAMCALFEAVWARSVGLADLDASAAGADLDSTDRDLMGLLAAGHTDDSIARTLGWNVRTVRRHIHRLCEQVGARTRLQLGMEAVRRKWV
ncbi:helix-turn-helix domain-containing protein [Streptomyces sp. NPDC051940]|uniref:helix-turn-helix domain-containing protein n=1 Tax=Streptomyces sp. NPDC051940 TaxID=3155675 RepID=UPI003437EC7B